VGIGTTSPGAKLHIYGDAEETNDNKILLKVTDPIASNDWVGIGLGGFNSTVKSGLIHQRKNTYGVGTLHFCTNNTLSTSDITVSDSRMVIDSVGNVGIGTDSPDAKLQVNGNIKIKHTAIQNDASNYDNGITFEHSGGVHNYYMGYQSGGWFTIGQYHPTAPTIYNEFFRGSGSTILLNPDNDNTLVGIGTNDPRTKLHIGDIANFQEGYMHTTSSGQLFWDTNAMLIIHPTPTSNTALNDPKPVLYLSRKGTSAQSYGAVATFSISRYENNSTYSRTRLDIKLDDDIPGQYQPTNVMTLLANGNVGIGTDSPLSHAKLHVNGTLFLGAGTGLLDGTLGGCIDFESRDSGAYGSSNYSSALIGTRTHNFSTVGTGNDDKMEMVFFIGNNPTSSYGPDRFSFIGGEFRIHTPSSTYTPTSGIRGWDALDEMGNTYQNSTPAFIVDGGRVGIGTSTPRAGLEVVATVSTNGNVGVDDDTIVYLSEASTGDTSGPYDFNSNAYQVSIIGAGLIYAKLYVGASDERIKKNIVEVNDDLALKKVRDISCCWYNYIDYLSSSSRKTIGFIAQQVKEHLPEAVQQITDFLPDIMKQIHTSWNETKMSSNDLQDVSGIKYRFYVNNVIDDNEKMVELVGDENNCFTFKEKWENLFCYGKAVDDFHTLDKQKLFALNFSATQEIDRIQQYEKTKLEAAEAKIIALEAENSALKERLDAIEARLNVGGL